MTLAGNFAWLHRRRLHRRLRSRQHADASRPAHGADHRRALRRSRAARGRCRRGLAEKPLDRGEPCGDALARGGKMAARPRRRPRAVQDLLDLRFHRRRQYRPGDGRAARQFRRCDRAGDAGLSRNRPHRLSGQSVRRLGAAERKPAEGPSAQSDARFQSGAGAGAPEPDQGRASRSRNAHRAARTRFAHGSPISLRRASAQPLPMPCSTAISKPSAGSRWIIGCRSARPALGLVLPGRWSLPARSNRMRPPRVRTRPSAGRRPALPAVARRRRCSRSPTPKSHAGAASRSGTGRRGKEEARRALAWAGDRIGDGPILIACSSTPEEVAALQSRHGRDAAGHAIEQAMADIAEGFVLSGVRRLVVAGGETSGAVVDRLEFRLSCRRRNRCRSAGFARGRQQRRDAACPEIRQFRRTRIFFDALKLMRLSELFCGGLEHPAGVTDQTARPERPGCWLGSPNFALRHQPRRKINLT